MGDKILVILSSTCHPNDLFNSIFYLFNSIFAVMLTASFAVMILLTASFAVTIFFHLKLQMDELRSEVRIIFPIGTWWDL